MEHKKPDSPVGPVIAGVIAVCLFAFAQRSCNRAAEEANTRYEAAAPQREAEAARKKKIEDAYKERDAVDAVIRNYTDERRQKLHAKAVSHTFDNSGSVRIDTYKMKDGRVILCSTKVTDAGTFMNCNGEP